MVGHAREAGVHITATKVFGNHDLAGDGLSCVSLLWPALTTPFEGGWNTAALPGKRTLLELAPKICPIERPETVRVVENLSTGSTSTIYEPRE